MDKIDLLPGQRWQQEIPRAIRNSDFILIFFSKNSVAKRGYIQREFRLALDTLEEIPPDEIHTVPIRLDDCQIPEQFRHLQWSDLSEEGEFDRIVQALRLGTKQRQTVVPEPALEPPPDPLLDRDCIFVSQPEKLPMADQKTHRVSVMAIVSLVIAAVSALAAVIVVPEVREWLGLVEIRDPLSPNSYNVEIVFENGEIVKGATLECGPRSWSKYLANIEYTKDLDLIRDAEFGPSSNKFTGFSELEF
jgi:hypothetical protein